MRWLHEPNGYGSRSAGGSDRGGLGLRAIGAGSGCRGYLAATTLERLGGSVLVAGLGLWSR